MLYNTRSLWYIALTTPHFCDRVFRCFVKLCIAEQWHKACLPQSIILKEIFAKFRIVGKVQQGYLSTDSRYYCWHAWLIVNDFVMDCGKHATAHIMQAIHPVLPVMDISVHEPTYLKRIDMDTEEERQTLFLNKTMLKKHRRNIDVLEDAPARVKNIRARVLADDFWFQHFVR